HGAGVVVPLDEGALGVHPLEHHDLAPVLRELVGLALLVLQLEVRRGLTDGRGLGPCGAGGGGGAGGQRRRLSHRSGSLSLEILSRESRTIRSVRSSGRTSGSAGFRGE